MDYLQSIFLLGRQEWRYRPAPNPSLQRDGANIEGGNVGMPHGRRVVIPDDQDFRTNHEKVLYGILLERQK